MAYQPEDDNVGVISPNLYATPMRNLTENKGLLTGKGMLYAGTGESKEFVCGVKDNTDIKISVPVTTAINPSDAPDGSVLIKDSSKTGGWNVGVIGVGNINVKSIADALYPVGSIYMSASATDPSTFLGGTWERWGEGKVPVGVQEDDEDFNTVEKTGGEKTHTLTLNEIPSHNHKGTSTPGTLKMGNSGQSFMADVGIIDHSVDYTTTGKMEQRTVHMGDLVVDNGERVTSEYGVCPNGGDQPHNNLQPYITCYMWKRTA